MKYFEINSQKGFSVIEIIIVLAIIGILVGIGVGSFYSYRQKYVLDQTASSVVSTLAEARSKTVASEFDSQYGVHFESQFFTLFKGTTYSASDPTNQKTIIPSSAYISTISLTPSGADVIFQKITGKSGRAGTIRITLVSDPTSYKEVVIYGTGIAKVQ